MSENIWDFSNMTFIWLDIDLDYRLSSSCAAKLDA